MSRYRAKRPFATSRLKAPFLRSIAEIPEKVAAGEFPFTLPFLKGGDFSLEFQSPVTFFVGENGTGKSTLLEAIAELCGFNPQGGSRDNYYRHGDGADAHGLAAALRPVWLPKVSKGFFFRAESFFNFASYIEQIYRDEYEATGKPKFEKTPWTERSLHQHSHGEVFLSFFERRFGGEQSNLYLIDEPEAALSPERQLEFLAMIEERRAAGTVQFIIATHSPLLMAYPHADILLFSHRGLRRATLSDTPHFQLYQDFFADPAGFLDAALERIAEERRALDAPDDGT
jgi:predicted ATPase